jgi:predicted dehydrogenase
VKMEYMLDTTHGADYFRRWHSDKASSGGLLVHKSTHHFDLVNWWVDGIPKSVYCLGDLVFYGKENAIARGDAALTEYDRYLNSCNKEKDPFHFELEGSAKAIYRDAEGETGYIRDRNVFREGIDIEDTMSVLVRYRDGAILNYSLNAFCPEEGFRVSISGDRGRIEYTEMHRTHVIAGQSDAELAKQQEGGFRKLTVLPLFGEGYQVAIPTAIGGHGGGDTLIQEQIFAVNPPQDPFARSAGHEQGAASALIGIAANQSIKTGQPVQVDDLLTLKPETVRLGDLI